MSRLIAPWGKTESLTPIRKNNRGISGVEWLRTPVTGILIVGLQLSLDLPRDGKAL
jgi:hypothetical protein